MHVHHRQCLDENVSMRSMHLSQSSQEASGFLKCQATLLHVISSVNYLSTGSQNNLSGGRRLLSIMVHWCDQSMSAWRGKDGKFCNYVMPHVTKIARKRLQR